ncbi:ATP-binding cassette domain-containing protein, partial [Bacillus cereus]
LTYMGLLRGMNAKEVAQRTEELLTILELNNTEGTLVINYSTGMRKKIGLALALLHAPKLLVLDEPFEAVDPISASTIKKILQKFVSSGGSVVFS